MADKGDVYYCKWLKTKEGNFIGWEEREPLNRAEASTAKEMKTLLWATVAQSHDDNEAFFIFDPPLPGDAPSELFKDDFVAVSWNSGFRYRDSAATAFASGRCKRCGCGLGERTHQPIVADPFGNRTDGAFSYPSNTPPPNDLMPANIKIFSEQFISLLDAEERSQFKTRPVILKSPGRSRFVELFPKFLIPTVVVKDMELSGWRCDVCHRKCMSHGATLGWGVDLISRNNFPHPPPPCFFVGDDVDFNLCLPRKRWRAFKGKQGARGLSCQQLGVVEECNCDPNPDIPTLDETAEFRRQFGFKRKLDRAALAELRNPTLG
jgi:hypothetical protein